MNILDYSFYRIYSFYKRKRDPTPVWKGCCVLAVFIVASVLSIVALLSVGSIIDVYLGRFALLGIAFTSLYLFWRRYKKSDFVEGLVTRYKDEEQSKKRLRGWLIVLYLILVFSIPIGVGYMRHNLGMDI